ncbi:MAG: pentapeptide repeat-containing protein [Treponema sp.]|jgi:hypothetical protein|nr:pentapeptide repeat-containing protein [Treponema sp.]
MDKQKMTAIVLALLCCLFMACGNPAGGSSGNQTNGGNTEDNNAGDNKAGDNNAGDNKTGDNNSGDNNAGDGNAGGNSGTEAKTGKVTFFNESSYQVVVHQDAFSGPVLLELTAGQSKTLDVRVSDNYGVGSTFSIEYLHRISDAFDTESGELIASGIDPNVQINFVVEEQKSYTKQIPQPQNLTFQQAFLKILNTASLQCELRYLGTVFKQSGNSNIPIAPGKTGVYKLEGVPDAGKLMQNYELVSTFESAAIPDFTVKKGFIYSFTYNGSSVVPTGEQTIVFK